MKNVHLSEEEIHEIVFDQKNVSYMVEHIKQCTLCKNKIEVYKLIFADLHHHPVPSFGFEVDAPLPIHQRKPVKDISYIAVFVFAILGFLVLGFGMIYYIFKNPFERLENTLPLNWLVVCTAAILLIGLLIDLIIGYEKKIKVIHHSIMQH